jgi:hypothetical protein
MVDEVVEKKTNILTTVLVRQNYPSRREQEAPRRREQEALRQQEALRRDYVRREREVLRPQEGRRDQEVIRELDNIALSVIPERVKTPDSRRTPRLSEGHSRCKKYIFRRSNKRSFTDSRTAPLVKKLPGNFGGQVL